MNGALPFVTIVNERTARDGKTKDVDVLGKTKECRQGERMNDLTDLEMSCDLCQQQEQLKVLPTCQITLESDRVVKVVKNV